MSKTEVILTNNVVGLGAESDQVKVAAGYARNYLFPMGYAVPLTGANKRRIEVLRQRRAEREAHELNTMTELAASITKIVLRVTVKTGADGKMFGSVTSGTIADELKHQCDVALDKRKIHLEHPIRTIGEHEVELRLHTNVLSTLKVKIESSTPVDVAAVAQEAAALAARNAREGRDSAPKDSKEPREAAAAKPERKEKREKAK